ncbi:MAG: hypothetical protein LBH84_05210 [Prevotellaceae bacterium]|nr:hypothetical protein [Prevotellaceae bacterium]
MEIANNERISIGAIEKKIGASKGVLSRALANGTDIQAKWLQRIVENYPQYSSDWLLTGQGEMLRSAAHHHQQPDADYDLLKELCDTQRKLIGSYEELLEKMRAKSY